MTIKNFFRNATDQLEMFAYPVYLKAEKTLKNNRVEEFIKRWPVWSQRLRYFPQLHEQLCQTVLDCFKKDLSQTHLLETFFATAQISIKDPYSSIANLYKLAILKNEWDFINKSFPFLLSQFNSGNNTVLAALMSVSFLESEHMDKNLYKKFLEKAQLNWVENIHKIEQESEFKFDKWIENSMHQFLNNGNYSKPNVQSKALKLGSCLSFYPADNLYSGVIQCGPEETLLLAVENSPSFVNAFDHLLQRRVSTSPSVLAQFLMNENFKEVAEIHKFTSIAKMRIYFETKKDYYPQSCEDFLKAVDIVETYELQEKLGQIVNAIPNGSMIKKRKM